MKRWAIAVCGLLAVTMAASIAQAGGKTLTTTLTGAEEVPGPGDPDGIGEAKITLNSGKGEVCYELSVTGISSAIAAHIHVAPAGVVGPVVVALGAPTEGTSSGCVSVDPNLIKAIMKNPEQYYVNAHTVDFPAGAVRGQLSK